MKPKFIVKSLGELPADVLALATSMPKPEVNPSAQTPSPTAHLARREIRAARRNSAAFARDIYARAGAPFQHTTPWQRGGLNE